MPKRCHTVVITGGIVSGIGKGITSASIGRLLLDRGFTVVPVKADPYLNQDAGTMNPFQHGEVFVTDDGAETDLDLGHYERFLDLNLTKRSNFTSGAVYAAVMDQEREGGFLGKTIQIIPHVTDEINRRLDAAAKAVKPDFLLYEIGGTVGDIEELPYLEAIRQYARQQTGRTVFVHVVKMDYLYPSDEGKTKPIQHSVTSLRSYGIQPDVLVVRCKRPLLSEETEKIALFTGVPRSHVIPAVDAPSLYHIPANLAAAGLDRAILQSIGIRRIPERHDCWTALYPKLQNPKQSVRVGLVGKYLNHGDAYLSVLEAIRHAGFAHGVATTIVPINSEDTDVAAQVSTVDAVIVPGGFGTRGIEGKIEAIRTAREKRIPYLGICLGLQTAVIEIARHLAGLSQATSTEFNSKTAEPVIDILPDQVGVKRKGGTMRLGAYLAVLKPGSLAESIYQQYRPEEIVTGTISERHRHRYEVNPRYHAELIAAGLVFSGMSPDGSLAEFIELPRTVHPYFIATQAHPEFRSRPHRPHPLFAGLIGAAVEPELRKKATRSKRETRSAPLVA